MPNYRGGLGHGHRFAATVSGEIGNADFRDVMAGVDAMIERGVADPDRLAIGGWSQGGFMTAWAVGQTDRFKAAVMGAGVCDWRLMVAESDMTEFELDLAGDAPWDGFGPHRADRQSPISYARRVRTPVLILHGERDERVPASQGRFFGAALRRFNVPVEQVIYPREPHGVRERNHQLDLHRRLVAWYRRWLG
jgi:dipeptidyl aminopeptidase/acylaminoacyl peptidase